MISDRHDKLVKPGRSGFRYTFGFSRNTDCKAFRWFRCRSLGKPKRLCFAFRCYLVVYKGLLTGGGYILVVSSWGPAGRRRLP